MATGRRTVNVVFGLTLDVGPGETATNVLSYACQAFGKPMSEYQLIHKGVLDGKSLTSTTFLEAGNECILQLRQKSLIEKKPLKLKQRLKIINQLIGNSKMKDEDRLAQIIQLSLEFPVENPVDISALRPVFGVSQKVRESVPADDATPTSTPTSTAGSSSERRPPLPLSKNNSIELGVPALGLASTSRDISAVPELFAPSTNRSIPQTPPLEPEASKRQPNPPPLTNDDFMSAPPPNMALPLPSMPSPLPSMPSFPKMPTLSTLSALGSESSPMTPMVSPPTLPVSVATPPAPLVSPSRFSAVPPVGLGTPPQLNSPLPLPTLGELPSLGPPPSFLDSPAPKTSTDAENDVVTLDGGVGDKNEKENMSGVEMPSPFKIPGTTSFASTPNAGSGSVGLPAGLGLAPPAFPSPFKEPSPDSASTETKEKEHKKERKKGKRARRTRSSNSLNSPSGNSGSESLPSSTRSSPASTPGSSPVGNASVLSSALERDDNHTLPALLESKEEIRPASQLPARNSLTALYDYTAADQTQLSFSAGSLLKKLSDSGTGWMHAELDGKTGWIPSTYVKLAEEEAVSVGGGDRNGLLAERSSDNKHVVSSEKAAMLARRAAVLSGVIDMPSGSLGIPEISGAAERRVRSATVAASSPLISRKGQERSSATMDLDLASVSVKGSLGDGSNASTGALATSVFGRMAMAGIGAAGSSEPLGDSIAIEVMFPTQGCKTSTFHVQSKLPYLSLLDTVISYMDRQGWKNPHDNSSIRKDTIVLFMSDEAVFRGKGSPIFLGDCVSAYASRQPRSVLMAVPAKRVLSIRCPNFIQGSSSGGCDPNVGSVDITVDQKTCVTDVISSVVDNFLKNVEDMNAVLADGDDLSTNGAVGSEWESIPDWDGSKNPCDAKDREWVIVASKTSSGANMEVSLLSPSQKLWLLAVDVEIKLVSRNAKAIVVCNSPSSPSHSKVCATWLDYGADVDDVLDDLAPKFGMEGDLSALVPFGKKVVLSEAETLFGLSYFPVSKFELIEKEVGEREEYEVQTKDIWTELEDTPDNIFVEEGEVSACSLNKIVEWITSDRSKDVHLSKAFLYTYQTYATPRVLLTKLIERFDVPSFLPEMDRSMIQVRVLNLLRMWIENKWVDFESNSETKKSLVAFVNSGKLSVTKSKKLKNMIAASESGEAELRSRQFSSEPPAPLIDVSKVIDDFWDVPEEEIARQMTLIDFRYFEAIQPREFLNQAWSKAKYKHRAKNILAMIGRINELSNWVQWAILESPKTKTRAQRWTRIIKVCRYLKKLNNFMSLIAIVGGMNKASVHRLKITKKEMGKKVCDEMEDLMKMASSSQSYKVYRGALHSLPPPAIPYIGVHLQDLVFIDDGNPNLVEGGPQRVDPRKNLLNVEKMKLVYGVLLEIATYQKGAYNLKTVSQLQRHLKDFKSVSDDESYKLSLEREPRKEH